MTMRWSGCAGEQEGEGGQGVGAGVLGARGRRWGLEAPREALGAVGTPLRPSGSSCNKTSAGRWPQGTD